MSDKYIRFRLDSHSDPKLEEYLVKTKSSKYSVKISKHQTIDILFHDWDPLRVGVRVDHAIDFHKFAMRENIDLEVCTTEFKKIIDTNQLDLLEYFVKRTCIAHDYIFKLALLSSNIDAISIMLDWGGIDIFMAFTEICRGGNIEIIKLFLEKSRDDPLFIESAYSRKKQALLYAMSHNDPLIFQLFIDYGFNFGMYYNMLIKRAIMDGLVEIARFFFDEGSRPQINPEYFEIYATDDNIEMIELLFDIYDDFSQHWIDKLFVHSEKYSADMVQIFIDKGADVEKYGRKLYLAAMKNKNDELVEYLGKILDD